MAVEDHKAGPVLSLGCSVVTVSDTRTAAEDKSGARIREMLEAAGHSVTAYAIVPDDPAVVRDTVRTDARRDEVDAVVLSGGTGVAPRDNTVEAVGAIFTRRIDGFGELFRMLSYEEIGSAAMMSRAVGGLVGETAVFALPGSTAGCELALSKLILPELVHIVRLANPGRAS